MHPSQGWLGTLSNTASCATCHLFVGTTGQGVTGVGTLPVAHAQHIGTAAGQKNYACNVCHPNWTTGSLGTTAHQSNRVNLIPTGPFGLTTLSGTYLGTTASALSTTSVKYGVGTAPQYGTCNNLYCHLQTTSPKWVSTIGNAAQGGCTLCHLKGVTVAGTPNPSSGLHYSTTAPTVTGRMHDDGIATSTSKCGYCHESLQVQTSHVNGTGAPAGVWGPGPWAAPARARARAWEPAWDRSPTRDRPVGNLIWPLWRTWI